jgi:hypothetical protein
VPFWQATMDDNPRMSAARAEYVNRFAVIVDENLVIKVGHPGEFGV